jgi:uncharacterized protein YidB (DUF937 family)
MGSPIVMALLSMLAQRAMRGNMQGGGSSLPGGLGGGSVLGGLGGLLEMFRQNGRSDAVDSWIGTGPNQQISPDEMREALGPDTIEELSQTTGQPSMDVLRELSDSLPQHVDALTPDGRLPDNSQM